MLWSSQGLTSWLITIHMDTNTQILSQSHWLHDSTSALKCTIYHKPVVQILTENKMQPSVLKLQYLLAENKIITVDELCKNLPLCYPLIKKKKRWNWVLPRWFVPVILTETSITERVVLPASRWRCCAVLLFSTTPLVWVESDTGCLMAVCTCRERTQFLKLIYYKPKDTHLHVPSLINSYCEYTVHVDMYSYFGLSPSRDAKTRLTLTAVACVQTWAIPWLHGGVHAGYSCGVKFRQLVGLLAVCQIVLLCVTDIILCRVLSLRYLPFFYVLKRGGKKG